MLIHPIIDKLKTLRLNAMALTLEEQMQMPDIESLSFEERLGLMVDREATDRENRRLKTRLKKAKLKQNACIEDIGGVGRSTVIHYLIFQESNYHLL